MSSVQVAVAFGIIHAISALNCNPVLDNCGTLDVQSTLYGCSSNITDVRVPYSVKNSSFITSVIVQIEVNNFYDLNAVDGTVTIDFNLRMRWFDPRWDIPEMWQYLTNIEYDQGLVIEQWVRPTDFRPLHLWIPDVIMRDAISVTELASTFMIRPGGELYQAQHKQYTVGQPHFEYYKYPLDNQDLTLVFESFAYDINVLNITFDNPPLIYNRWSDDFPINFAANLQWTHVEGDWRVSTKITKSQYDISRSDKTVQKLFLSFKVTRESSGVILRFLLPIFIMMLLAAMVFWAEPAARVSTTMGLLGSTTAMFIVIFSNIPLVGYLTTLDHYILVMYGLLLFCIGMHHMGDNLRNKGDKYPQRTLLTRFLEAWGRTIIIGSISITFVVMFGNKYRIIPVVISVGMVTLVILWRELGGLHKQWMIVMESVLTKKEKLLTDDTSEPLTWAEVNLYKYFAQNHILDTEKKKLAEKRRNVRESIEKIDTDSRNEKTLRASEVNSMKSTSGTSNPVLKISLSISDNDISDEL